MIVEHLTKADATQIATIHEFFNDYGYASYEGEDFQSFFNKAPYQFLCLYEDSRLIGALLFSHLEDEAEIIEIAIAQDKQGQGFAKSLLSTLQDILIARSCQRLILEVAETNLPARSLYERFGFTVCGKRSGYYQRITGDTMKKIDALIMELWLLKV